MSRTYSVVGINLKAIPLGESDRLLTILTPEQGLIRAIAPGARKPRSKLRGNSGLFLVNELLIAKGRSLDKITQAEIVKSYSGLSQNLGKLAAGQYLAELALAMALTEQPQAELFVLLNEHLDRLEQLNSASERQKSWLILAYLVQGVFHLLAFGGVAPQVQFCSLTQQRVKPNFHQLQWQVGFSIASGGIVNLSNWHQRQKNQQFSATLAESSNRYTVEPEADFEVKIDARLTPEQLSILQQLTNPQLREYLPPEIDFNLQPSAIDSLSNWILIEQLLRQYAEYHIGKKIRSAPLVDTYIQQSDQPNQAFSNF